MQIHEGVIQKIPFFRNKDQTFVAQIVPLLIPLKLSPSNYLYQRGDHPYDIFFVCQGRVNFLMHLGECVFKTWPRGAYFGEIEIVFDKRRLCSAKAGPDEPCELFTLSKKHYQTFIHRDYPDVAEEMKRVAHAREEKIEASLEKS